MKELSNIRDIGPITSATRQQAREDIPSSQYVMDRMENYATIL